MWQSDLHWAVETPDRYKRGGIYLCDLPTQLVTETTDRLAHVQTQPVTLLHALGVDLKVHQELLRHADIRTTMNIYTRGSHCNARGEQQSRSFGAASAGSLT